MPRQMPEQRRARGDALVQQRVEAEPAQVRHAGRESADTREHERVGLLEVVASSRVMVASAPTCSSAFSTERRLPMS